MRKLRLLLAAATLLASGPMPVAATAEDSRHGRAATASSHEATSPGSPRFLWFFDGRDDTRDFPTNGFFPGDFAADPAHAAIGAAGLLGSTPRSGGTLAPDGAGWQADRGSCTRHRQARVHHWC